VLRSHKGHHHKVGCLWYSPSASRVGSIGWGDQRGRGP